VHYKVLVSMYHPFWMLPPFRTTDAEHPREEEFKFYQQFVLTKFYYVSLYWSNHKN
jgi:hypothetical protein